MNAVYGRNYALKVVRRGEKPRRKCLRVLQIGEKDQQDDDDDELRDVDDDDFEWNMPPRTNFFPDRTKW